MVSVAITMASGSQDATCVASTVASAGPAMNSTSSSELSSEKAVLSAWRLGTRCVQRARVSVDWEPVVAKNGASTNSTQVGACSRAATTKAALAVAEIAKPMRNTRACP